MKLVAATPIIDSIVEFDVIGYDAFTDNGIQIAHVLFDMSINKWVAFGESCETYSTVSAADAAEQLPVL